MLVNINFLKLHVLKNQRGLFTTITRYVKTLLFLALKLKSHVSDHFAKVERSSDKTWCKWLGNLEEKNKVVSSANKETDD